MKIASPWIIGFSVLDPVADAYGGPDAMHKVFIDRLARALADKIIPGGVISFRRVPRAHERHQWMVTSMREDLHRALTDLIMSWSETEDVDTAEILP